MFSPMKSAFDRARAIAAVLGLALALTLAGPPTVKAASEASLFE
jgi:hypothetical protein